MIEIGVTPIDVWYGHCRRFESGAAAREAWVAISDLNPDGSWHVGILRHQRVGKDAEPVLVSIVGDKLDGFERAEAALVAQGGEEIELHPQTWLQLVKRRVEVVIALDARGAQPGRHLIPHPWGGDVL